MTFGLTAIIFLVCFVLLLAVAWINPRQKQGVCEICRTPGLVEPITRDLIGHAGSAYSQDAYLCAKCTIEAIRKSKEHKA